MKGQVAEATIIVAQGKVLVASASKPGLWYEVSKDGCPCEGYKHRQTCRHTKAVVAMYGAEERGETDVATVLIEPVQTTTCPRCHQVVLEKNLMANGRMCVLCTGVHLD